ncbi:hypothetical protein HDU76_009899, partial [Blyttiomyces sp. JEL0837]
MISSEQQLLDSEAKEDANFKNIVYGFLEEFGPFPDNQSNNKEDNLLTDHSDLESKILRKIKHFEEKMDRGIQIWEPPPLILPPNFSETSRALAFIHEQQKFQHCKVTEVKVPQLAQLPPRPSFSSTPSTPFYDIGSFQMPDMQNQNVEYGVINGKGSPELTKADNLATAKILPTPSPQQTAPSVGSHPYDNNRTQTTPKRPRENSSELDVNRKRKASNARPQTTPAVPKSGTVNKSTSKAHPARAPSQITTSTSPPLPTGRHSFDLDDAEAKIGTSRIFSNVSASLGNKNDTNRGSRPATAPNNQSPTEKKPGYQGADHRHRKANSAASSMVGARGAVASKTGTNGSPFQTA